MDIDLNMLEIIGRGYVIQHCISLFKKYQEELSYRFYETELLRGIAKSLGLNVNMTYRDILEPKKEETRTAGEIISNIKKKLNERG